MTIRTTADGTKTILQVGGADKLIIHDTGDVEAAGNLKASGKVQGQPATDVGDVVTFEQAFGVGQTLVDVKASRAIATNYINTTGKTIFVMVAVGSAVGPYSVVATVNGIDIQGTGSPTTTATAVFFPVPPGGAYAINMDGGSSYNIYTWVEYR